MSDIKMTDEQIGKMIGYAYWDNDEGANLFDQFIDEYRLLKASVDTKNSQLETCKEAIEAIVKENRIKKAKMDDWIQKVEAEARGYMKLLSDKKPDMSSLITTIESLKKELSEHIDRAANNGEFALEQTTKLESQKKDIDRLDYWMKFYKGQSEHHEKEAMLYQDELSKAMQQLESQKEALKGSADISHIAGSKIKELESTVKSQKEEIERLSNERKENEEIIKRKLEIKQNAVDGAMTEIESFKSIISSQNEEIKSLQKENERQSSRIKQLENGYRQMRDH